MEGGGDTILIGAGGTLVYGLLGALAHLHVNGHLVGINRFVGVSAGSIIATLLCAGIDVKTIVRTFFDSNFSSYQSISPVTLIASYGLDSGARIMDKIASIFCSSGFNRHVTFAQLKSLTQRDLAVGTCDILEKKFVLMCADTFPNVEVLSAVRASIAVPVLFSPEVIGDRLFVDGAVISSFPISQCLIKWPESKIVGLHVNQKGKKRRIEGILDYIQTLFSCVGSQSDWDLSFHTKDRADRFKDICVSLDATSFLSSPSSEEKTRMFESGFNASRNVFGTDEVSEKSS